MNVLSLCDGMSCGLLALNKAGIKVDSYFSAEIKPWALKLQKKHYLDRETKYGSFCKEFMQIGDVNKVSYKDSVLTFEGGAEENGDRPCLFRFTLPEFFKSHEGRKKDRA